MLWLVIIVLVILFALIGYKIINIRKDRLNRIQNLYRGEIEHVKKMYETDPVSACLKADHLFGCILDEFGYKGGIGEKLIKTKGLFPKTIYNDLWYAHKIRNKIAHPESGTNISNEDALRTRNKFFAGIRSLGINI